MSGGRKIRFRVVGRTTDGSKIVHIIRAASRTAACARFHAAYRKRTMVAVHATPLLAAEEVPA